MTERCRVIMIFERTLLKFPLNKPIYKKKKQNSFQKNNTHDVLGIPQETEYFQGHIILALSFS